MLVEIIKKEANRLKAKFRTADPYDICRAMRIRVELKPMGANEGSCKGFFMASSRCKVITLNSDLPDRVQLIILVHELGHAILHSSPAFSAFHEFSVLDTANRLEYEANIFAAEFMLGDTEVMDTLKEGHDFFASAQILGVPPELLDFKLRLMEKSGHKLNAPHIAHGDYLKRDLNRPLN